jgi:hypothetical protein
MTARKLPLQPVSSSFALGWVAFIAFATVVLSLFFACATPFVALATVSALVLPRRMAIAAVLLAWIANQAVGYFVLGYPRAWDSYAWGLLIGVAACASLIAALATARVGNRLSIVLPAAFLASFLTYEAVLFAATSVLPSGSGAFALPVVAQIFLINLLSAIAIAILHAAATASHLFAIQTKAATA